MDKSHIALAEMVERAYHSHTFSYNDVEFLVVYEDDNAYVVFRGTEITGYESHTFWEKFSDLRDVVRDLRIAPWPVKIDGTEYFGHAGFIKGALGAYEILKDHLKDVNGDVFVLGHSLGGAIALVVGLELAKTYNVQIITFGSPKVFCKKIKIPDNAKLTMYKNGKDLITMVPIGRHPVKLKKIGKPSHWFPNIDDHGISKYIKSLKRELKNDL